MDFYNQNFTSASYYYNKGESICFSPTGLSYSRIFFVEYTHCLCFSIGSEKGYFHQ